MVSVMQLMNNLTNIVIFTVYNKEMTLVREMNA